MSGVVGISSASKINDLKNKLERLKHAQIILSDKCTIIHKNIRQIFEDILRTTRELSELSADAHVNLSNAKFINPNFPQSVLSTVPLSAKNRVIRRDDNILSLIQEGPAPFAYTGLSSGGQSINIVKHKFEEYLILAIENYNLKFKYRQQAEEYRRTLRKANILGKVMIPETIRAVTEMQATVDDIERDDFFRIKRFKMIAKHRKKINAA